MPLTKSMSSSDVIHDFVNSDNPKFAGDSKKQRIRRALGAYYKKQNESVVSKIINTAHRATMGSSNRTMDDIAQKHGARWHTKLQRFVHPDHTTGAPTNTPTDKGTNEEVLDEKTVKRNRIFQSKSKQRENENSYRRKNRNKFGHKLGKDGRFTEEEQMSNKEERNMSLVPLIEEKNAVGFKDELYHRLDEKAANILEIIKKSVAQSLTETTGKKLHYKNEMGRMDAAHEHEFIVGIRKKFGDPKNTRVETQTAKNGSPIISHIYDVRNKKKIHLASWDHKNAVGSYKLKEGESDITVQE